MLKKMIAGFAKLFKRKTTPSNILYMEQCASGWCAINAEGDTRPQSIQ